jgi:hypothetical protein
VILRSSRGVEKAKWEREEDKKDLLTDGLHCRDLRLSAIWELLRDPVELSKCTSESLP